MVRGGPRAAARKDEPMTLCPVAIAVGCKKCPIFSICPAKGIIGDQKKAEADGAKPAAAAAKGRKRTGR